MYHALHLSFDHHALSTRHLILVHLMMNEGIADFSISHLPTLVHRTPVFAPCTMCIYGPHVRFVLVLCVPRACTFSSHATAI
jgi:hypothetical protein